MRKAKYSIHYDSGNVIAYIQKFQPVQLSAGTYDAVYIYREGNGYFVLSRHPGMGYIGLEYFERDGKALVLMDTVFFQDGQVDELSIYLPKKDIFAYAPINQINILAQYFS